VEDLEEILGDDLNGEEAGIDCEGERILNVGVDDL
jgi:hypothetical protein